MAALERALQKHESQEGGQTARRDRALTAGGTRACITGDALASVNPIYGQGLTLAALAANSLGAYLRTNPDLRKPTWDNVRLVEAVVDGARQFSTAAGLAQPHVGPYPRGYRAQKWVAGRLTEAPCSTPP
ncbi:MULTISPECIES: hypothetical protein [Streptomyces]|uniref:Uncharacterized protein n=1 Tax=Streptomyces venezuelae TaxID=54571 RepID=A0A5P2B2N4_STRVZ|nr:hypothetical protein [Streptomyces venezuelae]QES24287.1 hypothetical protein DEJ46_38700 [Streptomyces venezuelae]